MSITLYAAPMSSASPIVWVLAELDVAYESVIFDLDKDEHKKAEYLAINPMGLVPALVDDGQPMFESSAITIHLGEKYGVNQGLWPEVGSTGAMMALTWTNWSAASLGLALHVALTASGRWDPMCKHDALEKMGSDQLDHCVAVLDKHLSKREYLTGSAFSVADAYVASSIWWGRHAGKIDLASIPNVAKWFELCMARPAAQQMLEG